MKTDYLIIGAGCAGLYCGIHLPQDASVTIVSKAGLEESDSFLAQGGMCVLKDASDYESFFTDTLKAGHGENDPVSVEIMIKNSRDVCNDLLSYGVDFQRNEDGSLCYTKEGAHSTNRILYHKDITGREITSKLLKEAMSRENIRIYDYTTMTDLIVENGQCKGAVLQLKTGEVVDCQAKDTVLATGGIGGRYEHSTNYKHLTGDALTMAERYGIAMRDLDYVQIHPTTLYSADTTKRSFLISESVRGEGAKLYDKNGNRFVDELLPRDLLTAEIYKQMEKDGTDFVWEDLRTIPQEELLAHFPNIIDHCKKMGYDVTKECIPVVPAQHYFMGGIAIDYEGRTSMEHLYAVGETACNGVHGRNRLASNSLLESLVFAKRAALDMTCKQERGQDKDFELQVKKLSNKAS